MQKKTYGIHAVKEDVLRPPARVYGLQALIEAA